MLVAKEFEWVSIFSNWQTLINYYGLFDHNVTDVADKWIG